MEVGIPDTGAGSAQTVWDRVADAFASYRCGDRAALDAVIREMTPVLWHVVRAYRLDPELAADVIQATWLSFVRAEPSITDPRGVPKWLTTTARREAARAQHRERRVQPVEDDRLSHWLPESPSAEGEALVEEEAAVLWRAVGGLDDRCRRLLRVVAFEQRPDYARLAGELRMPVGGIGPTRGRCLKKLRVALTECGGAS